MNCHTLLPRFLSLATLLGIGGISAQPTAPPPTLDAPAAAPTASPEAPAKPPLKAEELEAMLAPIALYPDSLLSQMFMASTYPLEIVEAARWVKANPDLKGDALAKELEKQTWDPSVRSLVNFPTVLASMNEKLDLTVKLGDAFIAQQTDVMNTVQVLRNKAQASGNLKSSDQQKVTVEPTPPATQPAQTIVVQQAPPQIIKIESSTPQTIYVPTYEPTVVYGTWPYPAYPPYPYYPPRPPGYVASNMISFGVGVACGAAWGYAWGGCNWGRGDVDIDIDRNVNFNGNINRNNFKADFNQTNINRTNIQGGNRNSFQHNPAHRKGVAYRDQASAQKFGGANQSAQAAKAREQYRGRADAGRQNLQRDAASGQLRDFQGNSAGGANRAGAADRAGGDRAGADRTGADRAGADRAGANRDTPNRGTADRSARSASSERSGAFDGARSSGNQTRASSQRGETSRNAGAARSGGAGRSGGRGKR